MAARTDPALRDALAGPQEVLDEHCRTVIAQLVGSQGDDNDVAIGLELSIRFMRGAAVALMLGEHQDTRDEIHHQWQRLVAPYFAFVVS